jgi:hypothetical protein
MLVIQGLCMYYPPFFLWMRYFGCSNAHYPTDGSLGAGYQITDVPLENFTLILKVRILSPYSDRTLPAHLEVTATYSSCLHIN